MSTSREIAHGRLGVETDREARDRHHRQVVRAVADRDGLREGHSAIGGPLPQRRRLGLRVDDRVPMSPPVSTPSRTSSRFARQ